MPDGFNPQVILLPQQSLPISGSKTVHHINDLATNDREALITIARAIGEFESFVRAPFIHPSSSFDMILMLRSHRESSLRSRPRSEGETQREEGSERTRRRRRGGSLCTSSLLLLPNDSHDMNVTIKELTSLVARHRLQHLHLLPCVGFEGVRSPCRLIGSFLSRRHGRKAFGDLVEDSGTGDVLVSDRHGGRREVVVEGREEEAFSLEMEISPSQPSTSPSSRPLPQHSLLNRVCTSTHVLAIILYLGLF